jgi:hypothetical protein
LAEIYTPPGTEGSWRALSSEIWLIYFLL